MLSERLREWIYETVQDEYGGNIAADTDTFEKALSLRAREELEGINVILPQVLEDMCNAPSVSALQERLEQLVKAEQFMKHLLWITDPLLYGTDAGRQNEWTLAPLLKQAFHIVPEGYNLSSRRPANTMFPYKSSYDLIYEVRNDTAHNFLSMSQKKTFEVITACLIVYLDLSSRNRRGIEEAFSKENISEGFTASAYCRAIVNEYKLRKKEGFTYIDIKWRSGAGGSTEYSTVETMLNDHSHFHVKLLGEAGCGKTTIMKQMEYLTAREYIRHNSGIIPVMLTLNKFETDPSLQADIRKLAARKLGITEELLEEMLDMNTVSFYLDGFNEILDLKLRKQTAWSIDELRQDHPKLLIYLSDRALVRPVIDTMRDALTYRLYPMDNEMKESFIKYNCPDPAVRDILLQYFAENPNYYEFFTTPIKLKQLIELTAHNMSVPDDFDAEYLQYLFEREMIEKNDENVEYLEAFACALAIEEEEKMSLYKAEACIARCKQILGYTLPDTKKCINLLIDMGVLSLEDGYVEFRYESYRNYFWMKAFDNHLADLLVNN